MHCNARGCSAAVQSHSSFSQRLLHEELPSFLWETGLRPDEYEVREPYDGSHGWTPTERDEMLHGEISIRMTDGRIAENRARSRLSVVAVEDAQARQVEPTNGINWRRKVEYSIGRADSNERVHWALCTNSSCGIYFLGPDSNPDKWNQTEFREFEPWKVRVPTTRRHWLDGQTSLGRWPAYLVQVIGNHDLHRQRKRRRCSERT